jgi:hypothetical protein
LLKLCEARKQKPSVAPWKERAPSAVTDQLA